MVLNLWSPAASRARRRCRPSRPSTSSTATGCRCSASTSRTSTPAARWRRPEARRHLPVARRPGRRPPGLRRVREDRRAARPCSSSTRTARSPTQESGGVDSAEQSRRPGPRAPRSGSVTPTITRPPRLAAAGRGGRPLDHRPRPDPVHAAGGRGAPGERGADALRRGTRTGPTCCSPSAATPCARTRARSPSPAARSTPARPPGRPRCGRRRRRPGSARRGRGVRRAAPAVAAAEQLLGHPGPGLVARAERRARGVRRRGARGLPGADQRAARPDAPDHGHHAGRVAQPRVPHRRRPRRHLLGVHRRRDRPAVRVPRLDRGPPRRARSRSCRPTCWSAVALNPDVQPNTDFEERRRG